MPIVAIKATSKGAAVQKFFFTGSHLVKKPERAYITAEEAAFITKEQEQALKESDSLDYELITKSEVEKRGLEMINQETRSSGQAKSEASASA